MNKKTNQERLNALNKKTDKLLNEHGWFFHYVPLENGIANIHTHGLLENFNHQDIQIVLMLSQDVAQGVLNTLVDNIKGGYEYKAGKHSNVLQGFDVECKEFAEGGRTVVRVALPDPRGHFPGDDGCSAPYNSQYEELDNY